jgi:hypothetical protein
MNLNNVKVVHMICANQRSDPSRYINKVESIKSFVYGIYIAYHNIYKNYIR